MKKILILLLIFVFSMPVSAASIIIKNQTPDNVINYLKKEYIMSGANIENLTDYSMTVISTKQDFLTSFAYGTNFNSNVTKKIVYNFTKDGKDTLLNANMYYISNSNSAFQLEQPLKDFEVKRYLGKLEKLFNGYYTFGFEYKSNINSLTVTKVMANIDLKENDKIKQIGNIKISQLNFNEIDELLYPETEKTLEITYKRNKEINKITLTSYYVPPFASKSVTAKIKK